MHLDRYITWVLDHPRRVIAGAIIAVALLAAGVPRLRITNDMRAYFSEDNPQLAAFDALENVFDQQDSLLIFVVAKSGDLFTPDRLELVRELTNLGWQAPYSRRVDSLASYQHSHTIGDELQVESLIPPSPALDAVTASRIREIALAEPTLVGRVISLDGSATGINVILSIPDDDLDANDVTVQWARDALPAYRARHPEVDILIGGTAATNVALGEAVQRDLSRLVLLSYAVIITGLILLLRHIGGTVATVAVATLSVAATMGVFGWIGLTLSAVAGFVPSLVMTIAVADSVHILSSYYYELRRGEPKRDAIKASMRINASPVLITTVTTIIGVLTLNFSDSPPYRSLGNMVAVGVLAAYLLSMSFLPALLALLPIRNPDRGRSLERWMNGFADTIIARHRALLIGVGIVIFSITAFIPRNELTERWHSYFDETFEVRLTIDAVADRMRGLHVLRYALDSGVEQGVNDPEYLRRVDAFSSWLLEQDGVHHVTPISDTLKRLNRNMHGDDPAWYRLPDGRELSAQYLLLYELSLPMGLGLEHIIDVRHGATQLVALVERTDSERLLELDRRAQAWLAGHAPDWKRAEGTGVDMMFAHINNRTIRGLLKGMVLALALISLLLVVALRSVKLGLLSLITNLAPAGLAYGAWGLMVGRIDLSASVVMCMSIGIVVDDTVHFLSKYLHARRAEGLDVSGALRYAFNTVGVALVITTAVLVAGFLVLAASHFVPSVTTGTLLAMTLAFALVVDFLFMPPLLIALDRRWQLR